MTADTVSGVAGLLLAAGAGRRMGGPKALLAVGGRPLVCRAVDALTAGGCDPVVVVIGAGAADVRDALDGQAVTIVEHAAWGEGMGSSLRAGIDALRSSGTTTAAVVHLVDLPDVTAALVRRLLEHRATADPRDGAAPLAWAASFAGRRRNPVILDRRAWDGVAAAADGDRGARGWLDANADRVAQVACDDLASGRDLDTPADLEAFHTGPAVGREPADVVASAIRHQEP